MAQAQHEEQAMIRARKRLLRQRMIAWRKSLSKRDRDSWSSTIVRKAVSTPHFLKAKVILSYASMPGEVQLDAVLRLCLAGGRAVCVPDLTSQDGLMRATRIESMKDFVKGRFGIRSIPEEKLEIVAPEDIDLVLVPGAAFNTAGCRLGLGGGYYDRYLKQAKRALRVACVFDGQITPDIPMEPFDERVDYILTESRTIDCHRV